MLPACKIFVQLLVSVPTVCVAGLVFMMTRKDGLLLLLGEPVIESADAEHINLTEQEKHGDIVSERATGIQAV